MHVNLPDDRGQKHIQFCWRGLAELSHSSPQSAIQVHSRHSEQSYVLSSVAGNVQWATCYRHAAWPAVPFPLEVSMLCQDISMRLQELEITATFPREKWGGKWSPVAFFKLHVGLVTKFSYRKFPLEQLPHGHLNARWNMALKRAKRPASEKLFLPCQEVSESDLLRAQQRYM